MIQQTRLQKKQLLLTKFGTNSVIMLFIVVLIALILLSLVCVFEFVCDIALTILTIFLTTNSCLKEMNKVFPFSFFYLNTNLLNANIQKSRGDRQTRGRGSKNNTPPPSSRRSLNFPRRNFLEKQFIFCRVTLYSQGHWFSWPFGFPFI